MRAMTAEEAQKVIACCNWATICTAGQNGQPYAIEATPFYMNGCHCFMINPRGGTWRNLSHNRRVLLKYTLASPGLDAWAGVSCHGEGEFICDEAALREGWRLLGAVMLEDYSRAAETFSRIKDRSPLFSVRVKEITGRCSAAKNASLNFDLLGGKAAKKTGANL